MSIETPESQQSFAQIKNENNKNRTIDEGDKVSGGGIGKPIGIAAAVSGALWYVIFNILNYPGNWHSGYGFWLPHDSSWIISAVFALFLGIVGFVINLYNLLSKRGSAIDGSRSALIGLLLSGIGIFIIILGFALQQYLIGRMVS
jgi:hypothetical protein